MKQYLKQRWIRDIAIAAVAVFAVSGEARQSPAGTGAALGQLPGFTDVVSNASATIAANLQLARANGEARHLGFDTNIYPGDEAMYAWRHTDSPYEWVGYYLPATCHRDDSWSGKRETLTNMGWGLAVLYVGQQTWGHTGKLPKRGTKPDGDGSCSYRFLTAYDGADEAVDAVTKTAAEGFPRGTTIFLDIERMDVMPAAMRTYYRAWTARVLQDGRYRPGFYAHTHNAEQIYNDVMKVYADAGVSGEPAFWVAGGTAKFNRSKTPAEVGHHFAGVWQGVLDIVETRNGVRLPIDVSVASLPSPSAEYALGE